MPLPAPLRFEPELRRALAGAEIAVLATPTQYLRGVLQKLAPCYRECGSPLLVNVAKGIEDKTFLRISEMVFEVLGRRVRYAVLSGPSQKF